MPEVNIFLAFTKEDNELKELVAKKIETWNKAHSSLGLTFHPYDWLTDSTPETRAEHRDGQFFINKQNIDKCELMFALIINGTGTPGEYEGKYYPCATLYEVDYHRNRGKRACIFLNNDEPRQEHFQFATENGMGLFWCGDEVKFKETIYEKIDQILMQYIQNNSITSLDRKEKSYRLAKKVLLSAYQHGEEFIGVLLPDCDKMLFVTSGENLLLHSCTSTEGALITQRLEGYVTPSKALPRGSILNLLARLLPTVSQELLENHSLLGYVMTPIALNYCQEHSGDELSELARNILRAMAQTQDLIKCVTDRNTRFTCGRYLLPSGSHREIAELDDALEQLENQLLIKKTSKPSTSYFCWEIVAKGYREVEEEGNIPPSFPLK